MDRQMNHLIKGLRGMSLIKKLTLAYTLLILIPIMMLGIYTYDNAQRSVREALIGSNREALTQIKENLDTKILNTQNTAVSIAYNVRLQNFLIREFTMLPYTLEHYQTQMIPIISYAVNYNVPNIYKASVYMRNESIPELWNMFYWEQRLSEQTWYQAIIESKQERSWVYPNTADHFVRHSTRDTTPVVTWLQMIVAVDGRQLGLVAIDIHERDFFSVLDHAEQQESQSFMIDADFQIVYTSPLKERPNMDEIRAKLIDAQEDGFFFNGDDLYLFDTLSLEGMRVVSRAPVGKTLEDARIAGRNIMLSALAGAALLILLIHFVLRIIFKKLHQIVGIMDTVAGGNFDIRVPVDRSDELGKLAIDFNVLIERINALIKELLHKERAQKDAQFIALQYQINPHFIYNTIDSFRMKMELTGSYETADAITDFGKMLRYNMSNQAMYASVKEELEHVENYINLQKFRYGDKLLYDIRIAVDTQKEKLIKFLLQPIVENSIKHGLVSKEQVIHITVSVEVDMEHLILCVRDNGTGIYPERLMQINTQLRNSSSIQDEHTDVENIGLSNINHRIKLIYGDAYFLELTSHKGLFTQTVVRIPRIGQKE